MATRVKPDQEDSIASYLRQIESAKKKRETVLRRSSARVNKLSQQLENARLTATSEQEAIDAELQNLRDKAYVLVALELLEHTEDDLFVKLFKTVHETGTATAKSVAKELGMLEGAAEIMLEGLCREANIDSMDKTMMTTYRNGKMVYALTHKGLHFLMENDKDTLRRAGENWAKNGGSVYGAHGVPTENLVAEEILSDLAALKRADEIRGRPKGKAR